MNAKILPIFYYNRKQDRNVYQLGARARRFRSRRFLRRALLSAISFFTIFVIYTLIHYRYFNKVGSDVEFNSKEWWKIPEEYDGNGEAEAKIESEIATNTRYGIVIDSGSSQSRLMVFSWEDIPQVIKKSKPGDKLDRFPELRFGVDGINNSGSYKISPGISTFASADTNLEEHLGPMLEFASNVIPKGKHRQTPLFLFATAGVRLLEQKSQGVLMKKACKYFKENSKFYIADCQQHFRVISGEEEGVYAWVTVNYLKGALASSLKAEKPQSEISKIQEKQENPEKYNEQDSDSGDEYKFDMDNKTFGVLDMGGASTQIVFRPNTNVSDHGLAHMSWLTFRQLNGNDFTYPLFGTTFLGYGSNEAYRKHTLRLLERAKMTSKDVGLVEDPCLPVGFSVNDEKDPAKFNGGGSLEKCVKLSTEIINRDSECKSNFCIFDGLYFPISNFRDMQFFGISDYWYASNDILKLGEQWDMRLFVEKAKEFCALSWEMQKEKYLNPPIVTEDKLRTQCFKAAWLISILSKGYGMQPGDFSTDDMMTSLTHDPLKHATLYVANDIGMKEVSWTIGVMLMKLLESIPPSPRSLSRGSKPKLVLPSSITSSLQNTTLQTAGAVYPGEHTLIAKSTSSTRSYPFNIHISPYYILVFGASVIVVLLLASKLDRTTYTKIRKYVNSVLRVPRKYLPFYRAQPQINLPLPLFNKTN